MMRSHTRSNPLKILFLLFLLAFAARAFFPDLSYFFWDESVYLLHGKLFAGQEVGYSETFLRPPLLPLLLSPFAGLVSYELLARLFVAFLNSFVVLPVFFLTAAVFGRSAALIAAALAALLPVHVLNSRWILTDSLGSLLAFSSVVAFVFGLRRRAAIFFFAAGGILAGLAVLMKFTNFLLAVLLLPLLFAAIKRKLFSAVAAGLAFFAAAVTPFLLYSRSSFGGFFYIFGRAFHVVVERSGGGLVFFLYLALDSLGMLIVFLALGAFSVFRLKQRGIAFYLLCCLVVTASYSFFIVGRGVSKPVGLEWEASRFLLLFLLFALPFIGNGIWRFTGLLLSASRLSKFSFDPNINSRIPCRLRRLGFSFSAVAALVTLISLLPMQAQLARSYAPAIGFEDGLRQVTLDMGVYLRGSSVGELGCLGNCPPVAYYSGKRLRMYYSTDDLAAANHSSIVVFDIGHVPSGYAFVRRFCSGSRCAYLLARLQ